jgi:hypothetical protein
MLPSEVEAVDGFESKQVAWRGSDGGVGRHGDRLTATSAYAMGSAAVPTAAAVKVIPAAVTLGGVGPGGGVVFYDAGSQQSWGRYLEAAPATWSGTPNDSSWALCVPPTDVATAGAVGAAPVATASGAGKANTAAFIAACGPNRAASLAANYAGGGLTDWYLPAQDELILLYQNQALLNTATFGSFRLSGNYWSSSQVPTGPGRAFAQDMTNGYRMNEAMNNIYKVRPIRAISDGSSASPSPTRPSPNASVPAKPCVAGGPCGVGRIGPGGGIVFYDAGAEQDWGRYLEAAPVGWSKSRRFTATWCIDAVDVATGAEIGDGADNTDAIMDTCDRGGITAAEVASRYRGGRKRDWYLPSRAELDALVSSGLVKIQGLYWTSTAVDAATGKAYARTGTATGTITERGMRELQGVWPIRAF